MYICHCEVVNAVWIRQPVSFQTIYTNYNSQPGTNLRDANLTTMVSSVPRLIEISYTYRVYVARTISSALKLVLNDYDC